MIGNFSCPEAAVIVGALVRYAGHRWRVLVVHATCCYISRRGYERWVTTALLAPWGRAK